MHVPCDGLASHPRWACVTCVIASATHSLTAKRPASSSIDTLVKISKSAGGRLKPHAARLIPALLESLTVLEPQVLNYLSLRATEQEKVL